MDESNALASQKLERVGLLERARRFSERKVDFYGAQYTAFCAFIALFYLVSPYKWVDPGGYPPDLLWLLRYSVFPVCGVMLFRKYWPAVLMPYLPLYWHFSLAYCLVFRNAFTVMYSQHSSSFNKFGVLGIIATAVLVDGASFMILLVTGTVAGVLFFIATATDAIPPSIETLKTAGYLYIGVIFARMIFFRNNEKAAEKKMEAFQIVASSKIHDVKTPLKTVVNSARGLKNFMPKLIDGYRQAQNAGLPVMPIAEGQMDDIEYISTRFHAITQNTLRTVEQWLNQIRSSTSTKPRENFSLASAVSRALEDYAWASSQRFLVRWNKTDDCTLQGDFSLFVDVISNLLSNSLSAIETAGKGTIDIWTAANGKTFDLHFRDSALGISPETLEHMFDSFWTNKKHGTGVGLAFCKVIVEELGGTISCHSVDGKYAEFVLSFPCNEKGNK